MTEAQIPNLKAGSANEIALSLLRSFPDLGRRPSYCFRIVVLEVFLALAIHHKI